MVVFLPREWLGDLNFEKHSWERAGLISPITLDVLYDWNSALNEKVQDWTLMLTRAPAGNPGVVLNPTSASNQIYKVFVFSPGDTENEKMEVRKFFEGERPRTLQENYVFETIDWKDFAGSGVGDPQQVVFKDS